MLKQYFKIQNVLSHLKVQPQSIFGSLYNFRQAHSSGSFTILPEVQDCINQNGPLVALETAILTHGMPHPINLETALSIESIIRKKGAVPATIGILNGKVHIGMTRKQLEFLSKEETKCWKTSRRDLPYVIAKQLNGGTTVSGTAVLAHMAGIPIFVTGGIGGVHKGAHHTMDISADLTELGKTAITVVSAGIKSILDIPKTLEYLETQGVCVCVYGDNTEFPSFFTRSSGCKASCNITSISEASAMMKARHDLHLQSAMIFAVPIPHSYEIEASLIQNAIDSVTCKVQNNVSGGDTTPAILKEIAMETGGASLTANIHLIENNSAVGADLAVEFCRLQDSNNCRAAPSSTDPQNDPTVAQKRPVVIGGSIVDLVIRVKDKEIKPNGSTHHGRIQQGFGGVGRNLAHALHAMGTHPLLLSAVGCDTHADALLGHVKGMDTCGIQKVSSCSTASYSVLLDDKGEAVLGVGDMEVHECISSQWVDNFKSNISSSSLVVVDGNIPRDTLSHVMKLCHAQKIPVWFEPTDIHKATKPWFTEDFGTSQSDSKELLPQLSKSGQTPEFFSPNLNELNAILNYNNLECVQEPPANSSSSSFNNFLQQIVNACSGFFPPAVAVVVTLGQHGVLVIRQSRPGQEDLPLYPLVPSIPDEEVVGIYVEADIPVEVVSVSGAGDCLAAAFIYHLLHEQPMSVCASAGVHAAKLSLAESPAVPSSLGTETNWHKKAFKIVRKGEGCR